MPELPEVETVCRGLAPILEGRVFQSVGHSDKRLRLPLPENLADITGKLIQKVERRAKYVQIILETGLVLIVHLGMSGKLIAHESPKPRQKHDHVWMGLDDGKELVFNDPRRFGLVTVTDLATLTNHPLFVNLGIEPLSQGFTGKFLLDRCKNRKTPIKQLIMDASIVVGVGNIYASESLFRAWILPNRPASSLSPKEANNLVNAIKTVLDAAIASGGSTLRDYVRSNGDAGYFQHHFAVYGKANKPCDACNTPILRLTQSGRSTFFCDSCQH